MGVGISAQCKFLGVISFTSTFNGVHGGVGQTYYAGPIGNGWLLFSFCVMVYFGRGGVWCVERQAPR
jgi:hypothetical protein